jgi:hypothetical protein
MNYSNDILPFVLAKVKEQMDDDIFQTAHL